MKTIETTLCICECTDNNSGGTALEKAFREIIRKYDHSVIAAGTVTAFTVHLQREVENLLEQHKTWKAMPFRDVEPNEWRNYRQVELGQVALRIRPANGLIIDAVTE